MDMQNVSSLQIPEGIVRTIHDKDSRLLWGRVAYDVKYAGDIFQQTYSGKNLAKVTECNISTSSYSLVISNGSVDINSITTNNWFDLSGGQRAGDWVPTNVASVADYNLTSADEGTYVLSIQNFSYTNTANQNAQIHVITNQRRIGTSITRGATSFEPKVFTLEVGEYVKMIGAWIGITGTGELKGEFQLEVGSQPSPYEPYVGGVPAPNPDYPQDIQTVTGEQTVTISDGIDSKVFPVSLGSIELCKIGNYQDYIYKSGDGWYVHKEVSKQVLDGTENIYNKDTSSGFTRIFFSLTGQVNVGNNRSTNLRSDYFNASDVNNYGTAFLNNARALVYPQSTITTVEEFKTWLSSHNTTVYYPIATPTDTKITDATLVAQLNDVHEWLTRYGYNATVSGDLPIVIDRTNL